MEQTSKTRSRVKNNTHGEREIDIALLFRAVVKKLWAIILVAVIFAGIAFAGIKLFMTPMYRSSFTSYVNNKKEVDLSAVTGSDVQAAQALVKTYSEIITSRYVLNTSAELLGLDYSYGQLKGMVSVSISDDTQILTVNVDSPDPVEAYRLADAIRKTSLDFTAQTVEGTSMRIIDNPEIPTRPFKPSYTKYTILGALAGALLVVLIVVIKQLTNDKIVDEDELSDYYNIPVVGVIPDMMSSGNGKGGYYAYYRHEEEPEQEPANDKKGE